jgi:hypothetical protein
MKDTDIIQLLEHSKKQTEHLRAIRNWVAFAGIMFIVIPLVIGLIFWFVVGIGAAGYF